MRKILSILVLSLSLISMNSWAAIQYTKYFSDKSGCFLVFDVSQNKLITEYNPKRCNKKIPPDSTFKIPLSLMAFDQKLITQSTIFKWDGKDHGLAVWNQNQTPQTWLKNSVVWV